VIFLYEGKSKIIQDVGTCFAVGYTAGWTWHDTRAGGHDTIHVVYCSPYYCGAGVTLIVNLYCELCDINMDTPLIICAKRTEEGSDPLFYGLKV